jgi:hypothetical protein
VLLIHLPTVAIACVVLGGVVGAAYLGLTLVRRWIDVETLERHNDVAGFIIAVVGVVYGVLLALVVIAVWEQFQDARSIADREASVALTIYRDTGLLGAEGAPVRVALRAYARAVVSDEWQAMEAGEDSERVDAALAHVWSAVAAIEPSTRREPVIENILDDLDELAAHRAERLFASSDALPTVFWAGIIVGGVITVGFTFIFGVRNRRIHAVMVLALATLVGVVLLMILVVDMPFTGDVGIEPDAMVATIREFRHMDAIP